MIKTVLAFLAKCLVDLEDETGTFLIHTEVRGEERGLNFFFEMVEYFRGVSAYRQEFIELMEASFPEGAALGDDQ